MSAKAGGLLQIFSAVALSLAFVGTAFGQTECEQKCDRDYKGKSWWIQNCKKQRCKVVEAPKPLSAGASGGGSCEASCDKTWKAAPARAQECRRKCGLAAN